MRGGPRRVLAFDLDGTLVDFESSELACLARALGDLGAGGGGREATLRRAIHDGWRALGDGTEEWSVWRSFVGPALLGAGVRPTDAALALIGERYRAECLTELRLFPEVPEALSLVDSARLILMTNGPAWMQRAKLERVGLAEAFRDIFISQEVGAPKPEPAFFEAVRRAGYDWERVVAFGDDPVADVAGPRSVGMAGVWVNRTGKALPEGVPVPDAEGADLLQAIVAARDRGLITA